MSKLAALAKKRNASNNLAPNRSVDILNRLTKNSPVHPNDELPKIPSKLSELLDKKKHKEDIHNESTPDTQDTEVQVELQDTTEKKMEEKDPIDISLSIDSSLMNPSRLFFSHDSNVKRRKIDPHAYQLFTNYELPIETINKINTNFKQESPDDKVQNAQKKAFDGFKKLDIEDKTTKLLNQNIKVDIKSELSKNKQFSKPHKSFVVIGHVDAGKSTLMGRMLLDLNIVDIKTVNKLIKDSESIGKGSFALAWVMDQTSEERSRGVTIDIVASDFETDKTRFTAIDAPGHKDFVPHLINGVSQADIALLLISAITGEFESGFQLDGQTKEHTLIAKNLGIKHLCCVINKLDKEEWSQHRFDYIKDELSDYLINEIGFEQQELSFIPVSGLTGNNVIKRQEIPEFEWYEGPTLFNYLEDTEVPKPSVEEIIAEPFNLVINDVIDTSSSEFTVVGKIISGVIQVNDNVHFHPLNEISKVTKIKMNNASTKFSVVGEMVELSFSKKQFKDKTFEDVMTGDIISNSDIIKSVKSFKCKLSLFNLQKPLLVGSPFVLFRNNFSIPARITKIIEIDNVKKKSKKHLISKQSALVQVEVDGDRMLPVTKFGDNPRLGKIVIRREGSTIGAGVVVDI